MGTINIFKELARNHKEESQNTTADFLVAATSLGECSTVAKLIEEGQSVHVHSKVFGRLMPAAAASGNTELVRLLLEKGVDIYSGDRTCIVKEHKPLVRLEIRANQQYGGALQVASLRGHLALVDLLLEPRWQRHEYERHGRARMEAMCAAALAGHNDVLQRLLHDAREHPTRRFSSNSHQEHILSFAAVYGQLAVVETALKEMQQDPDVFRTQFLPLESIQGRACNAMLKNAIAGAAAHGRLDVVVTLLGTGNLLAYHSCKEYPDPLYRAARRGHLRVAEALLQAGANIDGACPATPPLGGAVSTGQAHMVSWLLDNKAKLDDHDKCSQKPRASQLLRHAMGMGFDSVVDLLTAHGAELDDYTQADQSCFVGSGCRYHPSIPACSTRLADKWEMFASGNT